MQQCTLFRWPKESFVRTLKEPLHNKLTTSSRSWLERTLGDISNSDHAFLGRNCRFEARPESCALMKVTVVGAGRMGRGIGTRLVAGGNDVEVVDVDRARAATLAQELSGAGTGRATVPEPGAGTAGDVVVLAVHYSVLADVIRQYGDRLAGRIVIDIANPGVPAGGAGIDFDGIGGVGGSVEGSIAEQTAELVPDGTPVVKAFNTTFGNTLETGEVAGQPLDVLIAGDHQDAKQTVAGLVSAGKMRPIDVGPLRRARELEQLGFLHISLQERLGTHFRSAVKFLW